MGESDLQMVFVLPWSCKHEVWQMWSTKFHVHGMYKGYDSIMNGTVTVPTADYFLKEKDPEVLKARELIQFPPKMDENWLRYELVRK